MPIARLALLLLVPLACGRTEPYPPMPDSRDAGVSDAGVPDAGRPDAGAPDAGVVPCVPGCMGTTPFGCDGGVVVVRPPCLPPTVCTNGSCSNCSAPAPDAPHFVDVTLGTNGPSHGGGPHQCALKSISAALAVARGEVHVAAGLYQSEQFPLVLKGSQKLLGTGARLSGKGTYSTTQAAVVFEGTSNTLSGFEIEANEGTGYCVVVWSNAVPLGHLISNVKVSRCGGSGMIVQGGPTELRDSLMVGDLVGVLWNGPQSVGSMVGNRFTQQKRAGMACTHPSPPVMGSGNRSVDGGIAPCDTCKNCPFQ